MTRFFHAFAGAAILLALAGPLAAQPPLVAKDGKVVIPMTLSPAAAPKPASQYYLLPEFKDAIPGNKVQMFLRCFMEQDQFFGRDESAKREKWNEMPLAELPKDLKEYGGRLVTRELADAARMERVDWQIGYFLRRDGIGTLLPDVQKMRATASALKARVRGCVAAGDFPAALAATRTQFALAKMMDAHPTLIGDLVGIAIATVGCDGLEEMARQPGSPDLFWSLTDLPSPFIDMRKGWEGERAMVDAAFDGLKVEPHSPSDAAILRMLKPFNEAAEYSRTSRDTPTQIAEWFASSDFLRLAQFQERERSQAGPRAAGAGRPRREARRGLVPAARRRSGRGPRTRGGPRRHGAVDEPPALAGAEGD